ncbi:MAG: helix-turn-helix domain-containing protein [Verrucomicrobia bacterium]|nr:helix-turn-helix domain-containing protein [Verrucomicrobiota bacterium]
MNTATAPRFSVPPVIPTPDDQELAKTSSRSVSQLLQKRPGQPSLSFPGKGKSAAAVVPLPAAAAPLIAQMLTQLAQGNAVTLTPIHSEMTTQQAAEILGVSRPHLVKLLRERQLPFRKVGSHRRIRYEDILAFKRREDAARQKTLDDLAEEAQKLGLY